VSDAGSGLAAAGRQDVLLVRVYNVPIYSSVCTAHRGVSSPFFIKFLRLAYIVSDPDSCKEMSGQRPAARLCSLTWLFGPPLLIPPHIFLVRHFETSILPAHKPRRHSCCATMRGLMQDAPLVTTTFLDYAARWHGEVGDT
jgi:hypothetical protein